MPQVSGAPSELNKLLESAYSSALKKYKDKEKASKIAWGAAKQAGWHKKGDTWTKGKSNDFLFSDKIEIKSREENGEEQFYVSGIVSSSNKDLGNDIVSKNALLQLVDTFNTKAIKLGYDHMEILTGVPSTVPIGTAVKGASKLIDDDKAFAEFKLNKHLSIFEEVKGSIQDGHLDAFSVEYITREAVPEVATKNTPRNILSWDVTGVGMTGRPMNEDAVMADFYAKNISDVEIKSLYKEELKMAEKKNEDEGKVEETENSEESTEAEEPKEEKKEEEVVEAPEEESDEEEETAEAETETKSKDYKEFLEYKKKLAEETEQKKFSEAVEKEVGKQLKDISPGQMPMAGTEAKNIPTEVKSFTDMVTEKPKGMSQSAWTAMQYKKAAELHNYYDAQGIDVVSNSISNGKPTEFQCKGLEEGYDSSMRDIEIKSNPFIQTKAAAPLEHDTDKVATGSVYYQAAPHIRDIYDPVIYNHLNDTTTFYGILKKVDAGSFGDRYGFTIVRTRIQYSGPTDSAGPQDESTDLSAYAGKSGKLKCQIPFMWYYNTVEVTNQAIVASRNSKGIGDLFASEVQRATKDLLVKIGVDIFYSTGTRSGMTAGSNIITLPSLLDDATAPFGDTNKYGHAMATYTTLAGGLVTSESGTPNITLSKIRTDYHTVIENGASKEDLVFVTSFNQLRKIMEIGDEKQRLIGPSGRQGFEGLMAVDGIPLHPDTQCDDGYFYTIDLAHTFIAVQLAPTLGDLYLNKDSKGAYVKYYFALVGTKPKNNALRYGLATS